MDFGELRQYIVDALQELSASRPGEGPQTDEEF
jgi:hypothetical protein